MFLLFGRPFRPSSRENGHGEGLEGSVDGGDPLLPANNGAAEEPVLDRSRPRTSARGSLVAHRTDTALESLRRAPRLEARREVSPYSLRGRFVGAHERLGARHEGASDAWIKKLWVSAELPCGRVEFGRYRSRYRFRR